MPITATSPSCRTHSCSLVKRMALILKLLWAVVAGRDEGQTGDTGRPRDIADNERERGALRGVTGIDIAHRDRPADRGAEPAAGHPADRFAGGIDDRGALARRGAAVRTDADAAPARPLGELAQHCRGAGKAALGAAPLADRPGE